MTERLRRLGLAGLGLAGELLLVLIVLATLAHVHLMYGWMHHSFEQTVTAVLPQITNVFLLFTISGLLPSYTLKRFGFIKPGTYLLCGALSGFVGLYCFIFLVGTAEDYAGFIEALTGETRRYIDAPPLSQMLADVFRILPRLMISLPADVINGNAPANLQWLGGPNVKWFLPVPVPLGAFCGSLYWLLFARRRAAAANR